MSSPDWLQIILNQLWSVPYLIAYFVGITLALVFWRRHPGVSLFAVLGFLILLGNVLLGSGLNLWYSFAQDASASIDRGRLLRIAAIFRSMMAAIAFGFLMTAIFGWRRIDRKNP